MFRFVFCTGTKVEKILRRKKGRRGIFSTMLQRGGHFCNKRKSRRDGQAELSTYDNGTDDVT